MPARRSSSARADSVFINLPFDKDYEPLYLALIAGLVRLGLKPRCVVEIPTQKDRLNRIFKLIQKCRYSIHDLSRVELSAGYPRFNMPFEAGLAIAWAQVAGRNHRWFLLEKKNHRLERTLTDLNGYEVKCHGGTQKGLLSVLPDFFERHDAPSIVQLLACVDNLNATAENLKEEMGKDDLYQPSAFRKLVLAATEIAELSRLDLLPTS